MSNDPKNKNREKIEEMHSEVFHSLFTLVPLIIESIRILSLRFPLLHAALKNNRKSRGDAAVATLFSKLDFSN